MWYLYGAVIVCILLMLVSLYEMWRDRKLAQPEGWTWKKTMLHSAVCSLVIGVLWGLFAILVAAMAIDYVRPRSIAHRRHEARMVARGSWY